MARNQETILIILLILLGVIVIPVVFIWSTDSIFMLTVKTWVAVFFLLLLIRVVFRNKDLPPHNAGNQDEGK